MMGRNSCAIYSPPKPCHVPMATQGIADAHSYCSRRWLDTAESDLSALHSASIQVLAAV